MHLTQTSRVAILLHNGIKGDHGKTGLAFLRYSLSQVVAVIDEDCAGASLATVTGLDREAPIVASAQDALQYAPEVLLIGIAPSGGQLSPKLLKEVELAIAAGVSVMNGLHSYLTPQFSRLKPGQWIWDMRQEPSGLQIGSGLAGELEAERILTVGTDMAIGKMSTSIELHRAAIARGIKAQFVGTGQAGMMISGQGIPLDAVRVDFAAGAVEKAVLELGAEQELIIIEGQGSLLHPGSTATLPLIRGSQPTGLVLVHRVGTTKIRNFPNAKIPPLPEVIQLYEAVASVAGAKKAVKVKAIALNTMGLSEAAALEEIKATEELTKLPCSDVVRYGGASLLPAIYGK